MYRKLLNFVGVFYKTAYFQGTKEPKDHKKDNYDLKNKTPRIDMDTRSPRTYVHFDNYDYSEDTAVSDISPGGGLYHGPMDRFKSVKEFIDKKREQNKKRREKS